MNVSGIILSTLKNLMCQRLGTSPLFSARLLQLGFLKCDIPLTVMAGRSEGEECLVLSLVFGVCDPWCCQGSKGKVLGWHHVAAGLEARGQADRIARLPLKHLRGTQVNESISHEAATALLFGTSSMAGPQKPALAVGLCRI